MTEVDTQTDVKEQETVTPVETAEVKSQETPTPNVGSKDYNWRQMEQKNEQLSRELMELRAKVDANDSSQIPRKEEVDELAGLEKDDLITYGQLDSLAEKKAREIVQKEFDKREKARLPLQTKSQYSDYDQVVTTENIKLLVNEDPDLEHDIQVSKNPYARAYKAIKQSKFYKQGVESKENEQTISENSSKPISSNSIGKQRPLSQANNYAKGDKSLFAEMQKLRGGSV